VSTYLVSSEAHRNSVLSEIYSLHRFHIEASVEYRNITSNLYSTLTESSSLSDYPPIPVSLFKHNVIRSVEASSVFRVVKSSGTSGLPSTVSLDKKTSRLQSSALAGIMTSWLGRERRPMILIDSRPEMGSQAAQSASSAAVAAMMMFGRNHFWLLDEHGEVDVPGLLSWVGQYGTANPVIFGFTFRVWTELVMNSKIRDSGIKLNGATVIHGGGWKKLSDIAVSNAQFKEELSGLYGIQETRDYYGMSEQLGGIWMEGEDSVLIPSRFSYAIIRDPISLEPLPSGKPGLIHSFSTLTHSYPGHSLLTEDIGEIVENTYLPNLFGKMGLRVLGRVPASEARGCSDVN
jgi:hypothetical protein